MNLGCSFVSCVGGEQILLLSIIAGLLRSNPFVIHSLSPVVSELVHGENVPGRKTDVKDAVGSPISWRMA
jgi:hypothetical protein